MDGLSHNTSWEVEHGVDGPLVMVSVFSVWEPVTLEKYLMKCQFISFERNTLKLMAWYYWIETGAWVLVLAT